MHELHELLLLRMDCICEFAGCAFQVPLMILRFYLIPKYSAIGPNASAGKNDKAAMMNMTAKIIMAKVEVSVFKVPALSGTYFFFASIPAMASGPMMGKNLPKIITRPQAIFQKGVLSPSPSKPLPLLAEEEVNS